jgi:hypothetical protein
MKKLVPLSLFLLMIAVTKADIVQQADNYKMYSRQLDAMVGYKNYYKSVEIFTHKNVIAVLCLCHLDRGWEMRLFSFDGNSWSSSSKPCEIPILQEWHCITVNDRIQVCSITNSAEGAVISFYALDEINKLSETPSKVLSFKRNENYFPNERSRHYLRVVATDSNELFIIGDYTESHMNPITFLGAALSGGHSGYARRLFSMRVRDNTILGQYNIPEWIGNNDYPVLESVISTSQNIFIGWIKGQECPLIEMNKWMCARYDLTKNSWQRPTELFQAGGYGSGPFLAIDSNGVLHSVWSYAKFHQGKTGPIYEGAGAFYRSGFETLTKTQTLNDAANTEPKIIADKNGDIHIFMERSNIFGTFSETSDLGISHLQPGKIGATLLISEPRIGLFDVAVSDNNDMHIVFVKSTEKLENASLEYVKIVK